MTVHSIRIHNQPVTYESWGKGERLLLIHGIGIGNSTWKETVPELAKNFEVITLDLIGYEKNSNLNFQYNIHSQAQFLDSFIRKMSDEGKDIAYLLGYSYGGRVVAEFLKIKTVQIKKIIFVAVPFFISPFVKIISWLFTGVSHSFVLSEQAKLLFTKKPFVSVILLVMGIESLKNSHSINVCISLFRQERNVVAVFKGIADVFTPIQPFSFTSQKIRFIYGGKDKLGKVKMVKKIFSQADKEVVIVPHWYHLIPFDDPINLAHFIKKAIEN